MIFILIFLFHDDKTIIVIRMVNDEIIKTDDINYAVYKIGDWAKHYEINQIGLSREIPVTKPTVSHIKHSMDEIRLSEFSISDKTVNGFVAIAMQLSPKVQEMDLDDAIALEQEEYENILDELDNLELLGDDEEIPIEGEDYLIYKLEKECHVTNSIPANDYTKEFYLNEMKKIEDALD